MPPIAQPSSLLTNRTARIGHVTSSVRSLHVAPPSVVRCTHPSYFGGSPVGTPIPPPPPTQPCASSLRKNVAPSNTGSTDAWQFQVRSKIAALAKAVAGNANMAVRQRAELCAEPA